MIMVDKKTIFILEDEESFLIVFNRWLHEEGYNVIITRNIAEAKETLEKNEPPSLFWIDYYLGENSDTGMVFFRWLKNNPSFKDIPAILVTITIDTSKLEEFERQGIAKTFPKVFSDRDTILAGIKKILGDD